MIAAAPVLVEAILVSALAAIYGASTMVEGTWVSEIHDAIKSENSNDSYPKVLFELVSLIIYVMFAVAWHRRYLLPHERTTVWRALRWDKRKTRFLLRFVGVVIFATAIATAVIFSEVFSLWLMDVERLSEMDSPIVTAVAVIGVLILYVAMARLFLWLPATAIDDMLRFRELWRLGKRNTWRLFWIWLVVLAPILCVGLAVELLFPEDNGDMGLTEFMIGATPGLGINFIFIAVAVTSLSICYRRLKDAPQPVPAEQSAEPV